MNQVRYLLLDEPTWFRGAIVVALVIGAASFARHRRAASVEVAMRSAVNLAYGLFLGVAAIGHTVAVTIHLIEGSLSAQLPVLVYLIGFGFGVPAWGLVVSVGRYRADPSGGRKRLVVFNAWIALVLVALGTTAPLAIPAGLNLVLLLTSRRWIDRSIAVTAVGLYLLLFVASFSRFEDF